MHLLGWKDTFVKHPSEKQEQEFPGKMGTPNKTPMQTNGLTLGFKQNSNAFCCLPHVKWVYPLQIQHWCFQAASLMSESLDSASIQTAHIPHRNYAFKMNKITLVHSDLPTNS